MSEEYTPTTDEVRADYAAGQINPSDPHCPVRAEFDRWLAEVERAAAEKAWGECDEVLTSHIDRTSGLLQVVTWLTWPTNPYRRGGSDE